MIGDRLRRSRAASLSALAVAAAIVAFDLAMVASHRTRELRAWPMAAAVTAATLVALGALARGDRRTLGLRLSPVQGWWYWAKATILVGLALGAVIVAVYGVTRLAGIELGHVGAIEPSEYRRWLTSACVEAPLFEEVPYRLALCAGAVAALGRWPTIFASGVAFGAVHFLYGNPGVDNLLAGYLLAWAFLKSESLTVPIALHALGNFCVFLSGAGQHYLA